MRGYNEERIKRKKIFYVPGMISLVLIPLAFIIYFNITDPFAPEAGLEVSFRNHESFFTNKIECLRKYKVFSFDNSIDHHRNKLNDLRFSLKKLKKNNDEINGIRVHFGKKMSYEVFVEVIDMLYVEGVSTWMLYNDDVWIFVLPKNPNIKVNTVIKEQYVKKYCGCVVIPEREEEKRKENHIRTLLIYEKSWVLLPGFLGLVLINIFTLVKFNKNK
jgi:biopolymer transport protein ExbD